MESFACYQTHIIFLFVSEVTALNQEKERPAHSRMRTVAFQLWCHVQLSQRCEENAP